MSLKVPECFHPEGDLGHLCHCHPFCEEGHQVTSLSGSKNDTCWKCPFSPHLEAPAKACGDPKTAAHTATQTSVFWLTILSTYFPALIAGLSYCLLTMCRPPTALFLLG